MKLVYIAASITICIHLSIGSGISQENETNNELDVDKRIYGGLTVWNRSSYQYVARLSIRFNFERDTICSGVVLTDKIILTVAHCVTRPGKKVADYVFANVQGRIYTFNKNEIILNPDYNYIYGADYAVLRKNANTIFMRGFGTPPALPINLEGSDYIDYSGKRGTIVGWGRTSDSEVFPFRTLQSAVVTIKDSVQCANDNPAVAGAMYADENLICTYNNIAGLCDGDWGGPLIVDNVLVGLNMFRKGPCTNSVDTESTYNNLQYVVRWLRATFDLS